MNRLFTVRTLVVVTVLTRAPRASADEPPPQRVIHLDEAVGIALAHQPSVLAARGQTEAASGRYEEARAGYLPQITGTAQAARAHGRLVPVGGSSPSVAAVGTYNAFSVGVTGSQLIWDFGQTLDRTRSASASLESFQASEKTAALQVALQARHAFFQARAQKSLVHVGEKTVANQERHLAQIDAFVGQGIRPEIDLAQARTDLANSRVTLINARTAYSTAKAQLNQAMGVFSGPPYEVADDDLGAVPGEDESAEQLVHAALASRPEMVNLERLRRADELTIASLRGGYGPSISAQAAASESGTSVGALGTNWQVGGVLNWPIFQGGLTRGEVREAEGNLRAANAELGQEELNVRVQLEQALLGISAAKVVSEAARDAVSNSHERLRLAEGRYESGVGSIIELDDAQLADASTGAQLVQAEYSLASARADLLSALGK